MAYEPGQLPPYNWKRDWFRVILHIIVGVLIVLSAEISWSLPIAGILLFVVYELVEDRYCADKAYKDIVGALLGFLAAVGWLVWLG